jgi:hypothetical protein
MSAPVCERCNDTGWITVRVHYPMSYVGAGWPPEDARGVAGSKCWECGAAAKGDAS